LNLENISKSWFSNIRMDILSGMTVALALIPESLSFAIIAGVNPMVSLYAAFFIAVSISFFGGRSGMISSSTGSMALLMGSLVANHGVEYLFAATILTGMLQFLLGKLKMGRFMSFVPHPVLLGFVNALAILIFLAQLPRFMGEGLQMYIMVAGTLLLIYTLPKFIKGIPPALIAIVFMTIITAVAGIHVRTVGDYGNFSSVLPVFHIPSVSLSLHMLLVILPYSLSLSVVGLLESLLTAAVLDEMTETGSDRNQEMKGQGIANIIAGFFGGMAGCALIGQSIMNIKAGGKGRLSTFVSGVFLLVLVLALGDYVKGIPMAALVGVMLIVCMETMDLKAITQIHKMPVGDAAIMIITMAVMIATHDLGKGVLAGVIISAVSFGWKVSRIKTKEHLVEFDSTHYKLYRIYGHMFFGTMTHFVEQFHYSTDPDQVIIDFKNSHLWDHSAITAVSKVMDRYGKIGKSVTVVGLNRESHALMKRADLLNPS
jgi:sulfate permease, SulP family